MNPPLYRTTDLPLAAVLVTLGHCLVKTERSDHRTIFCFDDLESVQESARLYFSYHLIVEPNRLFAVFKNLKSEIRNEIDRW